MLLQIILVAELLLTDVAKVLRAARAHAPVEAAALAQVIQNVQALLLLPHGDAEVVVEEAGLVAGADADEGEGGRPKEKEGRRKG
jgi:hypothetical protein